MKSPSLQNENEDKAILVDFKNNKNLRMKSPLTSLQVYTD